MSAIAILGPLGAQADSSTQPASQPARASIDLRVVIPTVLRVSTLAQPATVELEERHIAQGYIDVSETTTLRLTSNHRRGMDLRVVLDSQLVTRAVVRMLGVEVEAQGELSANRLAVERLHEQAVPVSYRLYLDQRARPGTYRWPVSLQFALASA